MSVDGLNWIILWQTEKLSTTQKELCRLHGSTYAIRLVSICHHIMQFDPILFCLGLLLKQYQTPDLIISVLYIAAKPKWIEMMLPTNKKTYILENCYVLCIKIASVVQKVWSFCWTLLNSWFYVLYKITNLYNLTNQNRKKILVKQKKVLFGVLYILVNGMNRQLSIFVWKIYFF